MFCPLGTANLSVHLWPYSGYRPPGRINSRDGTSSIPPVPDGMTTCSAGVPLLYECNDHERFVAAQRLEERHRDVLYWSCNRGETTVTIYRYRMPALSGLRLSVSNGWK